MTRRFNAPPGWPTPPEGWIPPQNWQPDLSWPPAPPGWEFFTEDTPSRDGFDFLVEPNAPAAPRPWYAKKRYLIPAGGVVLLILFSAMHNPAPQPPVNVADGNSSTSPAATTSAASSATPAQTVPKQTTPKQPTPVGTKTPTHRADPATRAAPKPIATKPKPKPVVVAAPRPARKKTPAQNCDPNYSGGCVPIASDVDCAGGSGNGPAYFSGTAKVVGTDIYKLDGDHDGYACDS